MALTQVATTTAQVEVLAPARRPGRPRGSHNRAIAGAREIARALVTRPDYVKSLETQLDTGTCPPGIQQMLWAYAYGKPLEKVEIIAENRRYHELTDEELQARYLLLGKKLRDETIVEDEEEHESLSGMEADLARESSEDDN